jgi:two-component system sensor histidine kinase ChvG
VTAGAAAGQSSAPGILLRSTAELKRLIRALGIAPGGRRAQRKSERTVGPTTPKSSTTSAARGEVPPAVPPEPAHGRRRRFVSPLALPILAINVVAPALLVAALLYVDQYRTGLVHAEINSLVTQGKLIAGALGENALSSPTGAMTLDTTAARQMLRRMISTVHTRARLYDEDGLLLADSRELVTRREVVLGVLPPPETPSPLMRWFDHRYDQILRWFLAPPASEHGYSRLARQESAEVLRALDGHVTSNVANIGNGLMDISVAVPVEGLRKVLGALVLSVDSHDIEAAVRNERLHALELLLGVLLITALLSAILAGTIGRPIRRLAQAADRVRRLQGRHVAIPDFTDRGDEIGDLSGSLRAMTLALYRRLDAIEAFAADVAHEIKNPLSSLRSAIETVTRTSDPEQQRRLLKIVEADIGRLNRLISDISDASRLDAELSRAETGPVDLAAMLRTVVEIYTAAASEGRPRFELDLTASDADLKVPGVETRLGQVIRNLVDNAVSFSPPYGIIRLAARREGRYVRLTVDDEGPGFPEGKLEAIFDRFYSERPATEPFGTHSGLGLSISRQIVEAHEGRISAENRVDLARRVVGARFIVELPVQ